MLQDIITPKKALFVPGAHTELRAQLSRTRRVVSVQGSLIGNTRTETSGVSARVYKNGTYGFSSMAELSGDAAEAVLRAASDCFVSTKPRVTLTVSRNALTTNK